MIHHTARLLELSRCIVKSLSTLDSLAYEETRINKHPESYYSELWIGGGLIHSVVCLTTGPQPLARPFLHRMRSSSSSFSLQYPLISLRSSSSCLRLLPRLPVTYIIPPFFPSMTCFRRQFLREIWQIQLAFLCCAVCRIFLSSLTYGIPLHFSCDRSDWSSPSFSITTFHNFPGSSDLLSAVKVRSPNKPAL